jgi:hypothetical protein
MIFGKVSWNLAHWLWRTKPLKVITILLKYLYWMKGVVNANSIYPELHCAKFGSILELIDFYTPVFRRGVLCYGVVRPSSGVRPSLSEP